MSTASRTEMPPGVRRPMYANTQVRGDAENTGLENAGLENAGTSCVWVAQCNIINVRGHVRVNVTAGRGDP